MRFLRISALVSVLLVTSAFSSACTGGLENRLNGTLPGQKASKEKVKLEFWGGVPEFAIIDTGTIDAFNSSQNEIEVEYVRFVNDDNGNMNLDTTLMSGDGVDLFQTYGNNLNRLVMRARNGSAQDLTAFFDKNDYDPGKDVGDVSISAEIDGKPYGMVNSIKYQCYVLNKSMFDAAGIPIPEDWTVEEYRNIAIKLTEGEGSDKRYGVLLDDTDWYKWMNPVKTKLGGDFLWNVDGASGFDKPEVKAGLQLYFDMSFIDGSMPTLEETITRKLQPQELFLSEKVAMVDSPWIFRYIKDLKKYPHSFVTAFAPIPRMDREQETYYCPGGASDIMSISSGSSNKEEAFRFMMWYQTKGMLYVAKSGRIPASSAIDTDSAAKAILGGAEKHFDLKTFKEVYLGTRFKKYAIQTQTRAAPEITKIVDEEEDSALTRLISIDEAVKNMKRRADEALRNEKTISYKIHNILNK